MIQQCHSCEQAIPGMEDVRRFAGILGRARRVLVLTGAGISAESGLPTYRGLDGLYSEIRSSGRHDNRIAHQ
jgi:NAD-dependent SIR2 family protein deacetylase